MTNVNNSSTKIEVNSADTTTLKESVQKIRDAVKTKIQMSMVSARMVNISTKIRDISIHKERIAKLATELEISKYNATKGLDEKDPEYKEKKEGKEKTLENAIKENEVGVKKNEESIEKLQKAIVEDEKAIEEIQEGKIKISLDRLNEETMEKINNA